MYNIYETKLYKYIFIPEPKILIIDLLKNIIAIYKRVSNIIQLVYFKSCHPHYLADLAVKKYLNNNIEGD